MFSTTFRYGLISLVELATSDQLLQAGTIADRHGLSANYLSVVLSELRRLGLVQSRKGKNGGYQLNCIPSEVSLLHLYRTLAGGSDGTSVDGISSLQESSTAQLNSPGQNSHRAILWLERISQRWTQELEHTTLADLLN